MQLALGVLPLLCAALLTGCADTRQAMADWIDPPSAGEVAARVEQRAAAGQPREAVALGEAWLQDHTDPTGRLHVLLAGILTEQGDTTRAVHHLERSHPAAPAKSAGHGSAPGNSGPVPPAPAAPAATEPAPPTVPTPPRAEGDAPRASTSVNGDAAEARAGEVVARVPR
jgi:hypothetical protein